MTTVEYLWQFIQDDDAVKEAALATFKNFHSDADAVYDQIIEIDVNDLEPHVTFGFKPDQVKPVGNGKAHRSTRSISDPAPTAELKTCGLRPPS